MVETLKKCYYLLETEKEKDTLYETIALNVV